MNSQYCIPILTKFLVHHSTQISLESLDFLYSFATFSEVENNNPFRVILKII